MTYTVGKLIVIDEQPYKRHATLKLPNVTF